MRDVRDERAVDLDLSEWHLAELGERGATGAKVVERQVDTHEPECREHFEYESSIGLRVFRHIDGDR